SALRSTVEPGGRAEGGRWTYVRRDGRRYYLDAGPRVFVDAWRLHALLHRAAAAESAGRPVDEVAALLEEAVGLYH
ncbi:MAG: hypothetical protein GWN71_15200, partial [Gammaproteobacteria bacterium]|nr:hypothetical protein [Gemmatimonadota bacterium]NIU74873.1 hypothetical protein [Gammaproteobacteria bacterium]